MNVRLLRMARPYLSGRSWEVPEFDNLITFRPVGTWGGAEISWPHYDEVQGDEVVRRVRYDWHWKLAKREIRQLLRSVQEVEV